MSGRSRISAAAVLCALAATADGCAVGPRYGRPSVNPPVNFKSQAPTGEAELPEQWWQLYRDAELDRLIDLANGSNQTVQIAIARVDQARAFVRIAGGDRYPTITLDPAVTRQRTSPNIVSPITGQPVGRSGTFNNWTVPVDFSYEADVFGRVRRGLQTAKAAAVASEDEEAVIRLGVQTDLAQFYYSLRVLDAQAEIFTQSVAAYREQVRVLSVQVNTGLASPLTLSQAQSQLQTTLAQQADIIRARDDQEHALAILCGQPAPSFAVVPHPLRDDVPPAIPPGLPASVLSRRPDVAEAEQNVVAANAEVGVATANLYPTFALTGAAGFESSLIESLFDWQSRVWSIVGGLTAPIFEGGRLRASLAAARAQYRQTVAAYVNQVLIAYGDVEDALTDLHALTDEVASLRQAVVVSQTYSRLAGVQYRNGLVDYLTVIDAERTLLTNQLAFTQSLNQEMTASIHLIKALGGGWQDQLCISAQPCSPAGPPLRGTR